MLAADRIVYNGALITLNRKQPRASALAVRDGRIALVGSDRDVLTLAGPATEQIDLGGRSVTPGFVDAHLHLGWFGQMLLSQADLVGAAHVQAVLDRLWAQGAKTDRLWIEGRGFDQEKMAGGIWPTRADLDRLSSTRPVLITRVCGHACVVNSAALAMVSAEARAAGNAHTGLYTEGAMMPFRALIPGLTAAEMEAGIMAAGREALRTGITSVGTLLDEGVSGEQLAALRRLHDRGALPLRVTGMPPASAAESLFRNGIATGFGNDMLRLGGVKFFADGSLGARTALLGAPYADGGRTDHQGIRIYEPEALKQRVSEVAAWGFQAVIHAIGDQAVREAIEAITFALGPDSDNIERRHRIEHVSLLPPDLLRRMADRKIVAVVQPQFVLSDEWISERVGPERVGWAYPFRAMRDAGIPLALSSDCPVERVDAFACLDAVVNRAPWSPEGGLTPEEAIHAYCLGGAHSLNCEERIGSLQPGKYADFVVLSDNPLRMNPRALRSLQAEQVYVGGKLQ